MSKTPETAAALKHCTATMQPEDWCAYMAKTCQKLETQRDEARAEVERLRKALGKAQEKWTSFIASARQVRSIGGQALGSEGYRLEFIGNALAIVEDAFAEALDIPPTVATTDTAPEIFEAHGREWYRHTPGDKMPCDEGQIIEALWRRELNKPQIWPQQRSRADEWDWDEKIHFPSYEIIGWRPADAPEKLPR